MSSLRSGWVSPTSVSTRQLAGEDRKGAGRRLPPHCRRSVGDCRAPPSCRRAGRDAVAPHGAGAAAGTVGCGARGGTARRPHGEGADELFAGYDIFREDKLRRFWAREPSSVLRPLLFQRLNRFLAVDVTRARGFLPAFYGRGLLTVDDPLYSHRLRFANSARCLHLLNPEFLAGAASETQTTERVLQGLPSHFAEMSPLSKAQYLEIATFMEGYLLHAQGDRMLMGNSVEGRFPYLDHRVADLAVRIPDRLRLRGLQEKYALRAATSRYLPAEIRRRPKQPYRAPIGETLAGTAAPDYVRELLAPEQIDTAGLLDATAVARLVRKFELGKGVSETDEMGLVGAVSLMLLHERFVSRPARSPAARAQPSGRRRRVVSASAAAAHRRSRLMRPGPQLLVQDSLLGAAEAAPGRDAVVDELGSWTYEELADEALRIARLLQDEGLQHGDRVALYLDNTARCVAGIFGTLIAGGVFIGVNPQTRAREARAHPRRQ